MVMKLLGVLGLAVTLGACATSSGASGGAPAPVPKVLVEQERFSTLVQLLRTSGIDRELADAGQYTLFAPTNAAFAAPDGWLQEAMKPDNREKLRAVLRFHVVPRRVSKAELEATPTVATLQGNRIAVQNVSDRLLVGAAVVADPDLASDEILIHAVDAVLEPPAGYGEKKKDSKTTGRKGGPDAWWW